MSPTAALLFYNRAAVESNRGSEQAHKVRAVKGAREHINAGASVFAIALSRLDAPALTTNHSLT